MIQTQTQDVATEDFIIFLKEKGIISKDCDIQFIIDYKYGDFRGESGTPYLEKIRLTKKIEVEDMLL